MPRAPGNGGRGPTFPVVLSRAGAWLRSSRAGLPAAALVVGLASGLGAVGFRKLIFGLTWVVTGYQQFGQQGRVASAHLPWLGIWFVLLVPVLGGLLYGPLISRFAGEARGHGVPEVMIAVADNGGRIRSRVIVVKALASALCIAVGGSIGREGPIVQIGSGLGSTLGQVLEMSEARMRVLVACGAAGGIAATFNAPLTGVFFGFELILREFSVEALLPIIVSAALADIVSRLFFGAGRIFSAMPQGLTMPHLPDFLLVAVLGLLAALVGNAFTASIYRVEDVCDRLWKGRPESLRPAAGGVALGLLLLAVPQLYGVGYPVVDRAVAGDYVLWFLLLLLLGKLLATSLTLGIGGSGGVFAPSLFLGAVGGTAFGIFAQHVFGAAAGPPADYGVIAMGAVFAAASRAPLTSVASVVEMTANWGLTLPVMLAVALSVTLARRLRYGTVYTTKLLRRGIDIDRPRPSSLLQVLTVTEVMRPLDSLGDRDGSRLAPQGAPPALRHAEFLESRRVHPLLGDETLDLALRQLTVQGADGLPVVGPDRERVVGWLTQQDVLHALAARIASSRLYTLEASLAAEWAVAGGEQAAAERRESVDGYRLARIRIAATAPGGLRLDGLGLPPASLPVSLQRGSDSLPAGPESVLEPGDLVLGLVPVGEDGGPSRGGAAGS